MGFGGYIWWEISVLKQSLQDWCITMLDINLYVERASIGINNISDRLARKPDLIVILKNRRIRAWQLAQHMFYFMQIK